MLKATSATAAGAALALPLGSPPRARAVGGPGTLRIQKLSWAGVRLECEGTTLFIDPWEDTSFFGSNFPGAPVPVTSDTPRRYVALSHLHTDHYDRAVITRLFAEEGASGGVVVLDSLAPDPAANGFRVRPQRLWQPHSIGPFTLVALPGVDGWGVEQVAWAIHVAGLKIFHGGDGLWHGHWWDFARTYGPFDLAFMPINGVSTPGGDPPVRVARTLPPDAAAEAAAALGARRAVPIHHGVSVPGIYEETPDALPTFRRLAEARGVEVVTPDDGAWIEP